MLLRPATNARPALKILQTIRQTTRHLAHLVPHEALEVVAEHLAGALLGAPEPYAFFCVGHVNAIFVEEAGDVHFGEVGVDEKGVRFLFFVFGGFKVCSGGEIELGVFLRGVPLDHGAAVEVLLVVEIADRADFFFNAVEGVAEDDGACEEGFLIALAEGTLREDRVVVIGPVDVIVGRKEERVKVFFFGDEKLAGFAGAGGDAFGEVGEAGDFVEDGVFGCDPVVWPAEQAGGEEGLGVDELEGVAQDVAVAVEVEDCFEAGEEDGEHFELVVVDFYWVFFSEVVFDDAAFGS